MSGVGETKGGSVFRLGQNALCPKEKKKCHVITFETTYSSSSQQIVTKYFLFSTEAEDSSKIEKVSSTSSLINPFHIYYLI